LAGLLNERDAQLADDLAAGAIAAEEEPRLDLVRRLRDIVEDLGDDDVWLRAGQPQKSGVEPQCPALVQGPLRQDRL
jgi:hypothetical protein